MKKLLYILLAAIMFPVLLDAQPAYQQIHNTALVVDTHTDILLRVLQGADISERMDHSHVDLIRLKEGGIDVQIFAVWPNPKLYRPGGMFNQCLRMISKLEYVVDKNPDKIVITRTPDEIIQVVNQNRIAACIGVEGGTAIENDMNKLDSLFKRGARYMGLTWNDSPEWASAAKDEISIDFQGHRGLTEFGKKVVNRMNDLGMIVDISHSGEQTFWDVIENTRKPIIASHSCVYNICPSYRNLKDDQIKAIARNGGVIFVTFYPGYLQKGFESKVQALLKTSKTYLDSVKQVYGTNLLGYRKFRIKYLKDKTNPFRPGVNKVVDHIDYIVNLVGDDYVGIGSDFDGISMTPIGIDDVADIPEITREMIKRGYSENRIGKILGENFMRVFREVTVQN